MQKEEKIVVVLLFMALGNLTVASWALGDFDVDSKSKLEVEGTVKSVQPTKTGGHLIIRLDSTTMPIFVSQKCGAESVKERVHKGDRVKVEGEMVEYEGQPEIVIKRSSYVKVLAT